MSADGNTRYERRRARARRSRRVIYLVVALLSAISATWVLSSHSSQIATFHPQRTTTTVTPTTVAPTTTTSRPLQSTTTTVVLATTTTTGATNNLPATSALPEYSSAALTARFAPLFGAMVSGSLAPARPLFFPSSVYVRMKTGILANPAADFVDRLWAFYRLDLAAYHAHLGKGAPGAALVSINPLAHSATWIPAGACENHFGYWHLANVRIVYREGLVKSFAIASLISWRSQWYVIHLGPNPRPVDIGTVALAAIGPGHPGPSGGC